MQIGNHLVPNFADEVDSTSEVANAAGISPDGLS
jgi:hypothetical protein